MIFHYQFRDEGGLVKKGRITADTKEIATKRLEMMSIRPTSVWQDGESEPASAQDAGIEPTPPEAFFKQQEELFKQQEEISKTLPPNSFKPVLSEGNDIKLPISSSLSREPVGKDFVAPVPPSKQIERAFPKRKQSFLFGEHSDLSNTINYHLSRNGKILHMCMQPDIKGKIQLAVVIEHDQEQES